MGARLIRGLHAVIGAQSKAVCEATGWFHQPPCHIHNDHLIPDSIRRKAPPKGRLGAGF